MASHCLRHSNQQHLLPYGVGLAIALAGCWHPIATPEAVQQVEDTFATHRRELRRLAMTAMDELEQSNERSMRLPDRSFYDSAWVSEALESGAIHVDVVIEDFYLPLVYVSTDDPQDVHDTCTHGGRMVKQLEPHWYICQRDWN
ncbi:MAG: hypothetical protein F6K00_13195 [Leptolyngbya sp. SIOISBB]|nr:hypothetical protein [Leptolyngbya sp. SIOISBB]